MRLLLTGGSGYIGSRLSGLLLADERVEEIVDVDLRPPAAPHPRLRFVARSVTEDLRDLLADPARPVDAAIHLAWNVDPLRDGARQRDICIGGTRRLLEGCAAGSVRHLLFVSSATAFGAHPTHATAQDDDAPLLAEHHFQYSAEKREAEALFHAHVAAHPGTLLQIVRPAIVCGPNVSNFIFRIMERPFGFRAAGLDPELQLVHEDDVAAAIAAIVTARVPGAFNVAAPGTVRIGEIARTMGVPMIPLPLPLVRALAAVAWKLDLRTLTEAPPDFVYFAAHPWLVAPRRLTEELGFRFRFDCRQTMDAYLAAHPRRSEQTVHQGL